MVHVCRFICLLLLWHRLWRADRNRRRQNHRRAGRSCASGQCRQAVYQGRDAASGGAGVGTRAGSGTAHGPCRSPPAGNVGRGARPRGGKIQGHHRSARAGCGGLLYFRPAHHRGVLRLQQACQGARRHQQRRHQFAALHVVCGGGLQGHAGRGFAARLLRRHRRRRHDFHRGLQHGLRASHRVPSHRGGAQTEPRTEAGGGRSAPHRHRCRSRPASGDSARHRRGAVPRHAQRAAVGRAYRPRFHRRAHRRLGRATRPGARLHAREGCGDLRRGGGRYRHCRALVRRRADPVAVLPGAQSIELRRRQERRAHQPASGHRADRQTRCRAAVAHRPAQRHGRARGGWSGQSAVSTSRSC